jgi:hypothetical protein
LALTACGGPAPIGETALRTAPLWMAEVDLPGCDARGATAALRATAARELWLHPLDDQLVVVTCDGTPTCVDLKASLVTAVDVGEDTSPWSQTSATPVDDDPIPLVRERDSSAGGEGETQPLGGGGGSGEGEGELESNDDPIPLVRLARGGKPDDDPIPLVRERDLDNVQSTQQSKLPGDTD